jgi:hypothetical protein
MKRAMALRKRSALSLDTPREPPQFGVQRLKITNVLGFSSLQTMGAARKPGQRRI